MRIELCEDNGFMNNGVPTLVILLIDGKTRFPYPADKTIKELYNDVKKIPETTSMVNPVPIMAKPFINNLPLSESSNVIQKQDIVKVTNLKLDLDGNPNPELTVGNEYRVIDIIKVNGVLKYYELIDDVKNDMIRIPCFPSEVELVRKFVPPQPRREGIFEITKKCICGEVNALELNGDVYQGTCDKCGTRIEERRGLRV